MSLLIEQIIGGLAAGAIYAIVGIGFNLVFGVMNIINLSYGSVMMIGSYGVLLAFYFGVSNYGIAIGVGLAAAVIVSLLIEALVVQPLKGHWWNTKIATLGAALFLDNLAARITDGRPEHFPRPFDVTYYSVAGLVDVSNLQLFLIAVAAVTMLVTATWLAASKTGVALRVIAQSPEIASASGINVRRTVRIGFAVTGLLGGVAGILNAMAGGVTYTFVGQYLGLKGLVVIVVAGLGNLGGCLWVGLLLGLMEALSVAAGGSTYREFAAYAGLLAILLVKPHGLFNPGKSRDSANG